MTPVTFLDLIGLVSRRLGDSVDLRATENGSTTSFRDQINVNSTKKNWVGVQLLGASGANLGAVATVSAVVDGYKLTIGPPWTSTVTDDLALAVNYRQKGFLVQEYMNAINDAILDLRGKCCYKITEAVAGTFSRSQPYFNINGDPDEGPVLQEVYAVEAYDSRSDSWFEIRRPARRRQAGWTAVGDGRIRIEGDPISQADSRQLQVLGYGYQDPLVELTDELSINPQAVIGMAAFLLNHAGIDRDNRFSPLYDAQREERDRQLRAFITRRVQGSVKVW